MSVSACKNTGPMYLVIYLYSYSFKLSSVDIGSIDAMSRVAKVTRRVGWASARAISCQREEVNRIGPVEIYLQSLWRHIDVKMGRRAWGVDWLVGCRNEKLCC
jgi:hypothetical protein